MEKVMQDARKEMIEELKEKTKDGATSRRFARKKFTEFSLAMEDRNKLFNKVHGLLVKEGLSHEEARKLVKVELRKNKRHKAPAGQDGKTLDVILIDDLCEGSEPDCDESAKFRTITGQCNNLNEGRTLWGSMTISMRRELPAIDDLYQIATYNDLLNVTSNRQGHGTGGGSTDEGTVSA